MATEKRLIDANVPEQIFIDEIRRLRIRIINDEVSQEEASYIRSFLPTIEWARKTVHRCPTVDAVEVVRCKDCKHWCTVDCATNYGSCSKLEDRYKEDCESSFDETTRFDDFCSYGERKDNG